MAAQYGTVTKFQGDENEMTSGHIIVWVIQCWLKVITHNIHCDVSQNDMLITTVGCLITAHCDYTASSHTLMMTISVDLAILLSYHIITN